MCCTELGNAPAGGNSLFRARPRKNDEDDDVHRQAAVEERDEECRTGRQNVYSPGSGPPARPGFPWVSRNLNEPVHAKDAISQPPSRMGTQGSERNDCGQPTTLFGGTRTPRLSANPRVMRGLVSACPSLPMRSGYRGGVGIADE